MVARFDPPSSLPFTRLLVYISQPRPHRVFPPLIASDFRVYNLYCSMSTAKEPREASLNQQSGTHIIAPPPQRPAPATAGESTSLARPRRNLARQSRPPATEQASAGPEEEVESEMEDDDAGEQASRKRNAEAQELSDHDQNDQAAPRKRPRFAEKLPPVSKSGTRRRPSLDHIILEDAEDCDLFAALVQLGGSVPSQHRILEIHVDASKADEFADFRLAVALVLSSRYKVFSVSQIEIN